MSFLCRQGLGPLFESLNIVDQVYELDKKNKQNFKQVLYNLKQTKWTHVICPHQSIRSHRLAFSLKAEQKVGFKNFYNFFIFDQTYKRPMYLPDALRQLSLLTLLDVDFKKEFDKSSNTYKNLNLQDSVDFNQQPTISDSFSMQVEISANKEFEDAVFIAPGSVWATKRWTLEGFSELISLLKNEKVYLIGSPAEVEICQKLEERHPSVLNLCGKTSLSDLSLMLSKAKCLFCNDSGTMHVASMVGCPLVSVFGPTTLELGYRPWSNNAVVVQKPLGCRPCGNHGHNKCPIGTHECMKSISGLDVFNQAQKSGILTDSPSH